MVKMLLKQMRIRAGRALFVGEFAIVVDAAEQKDGCLLVTYIGRLSSRTSHYFIDLCLATVILIVTAPFFVIKQRCSVAT